MPDDHQHFAGDLITMARSLMHKSEDSWRSLAGRLDVREDEAWLDEGRRRHQAIAAMQTSIAPEISQTSYSFAVIRNPRRVRMQLIGSATSGNTSPPPDMIICRDSAWWTRTGSKRGHNLANPARGIGLFGLELMILPAPLADIMDYREAREVTGDRDAILVSAGASERAWFDAPELVVLSVSRYELEVDRELGVLLANRAYIDNRVARDVVLRDLRVNPSFEEETEFSIP